jgi:DnaJ family protein C protein 16
MTDLEPLGVQFATVHSQHESGLARKIGVSSLPYVIGVADGLVKHFKENQLNLVKSIEFIRRLLPRNLITSVDDSNYADFLNSWSDNRVRVIFVNNEKVIRLRYLLLAFRFRERAAAGHMCLSADSHSDAFTSRYGIDRKLDSMLIFNEYMVRPIASLSAHELKPQIMNDVLESNKFLSLPRLSSQSLFDQLCPAEAIRSRRKLCVVLVTNDIPEHDMHREAMRQFVKANSFPKDRYRFMFIVQEKQKDFITALATGLSADVPVLHVAVVWRREPDRVVFEWLRQEWDARNDLRLNASRGELLNLLKRLSQSVDSFSNDVRLPPLVDEQAHGFIGNIVKKILVMTDGMTENISQKEILPIVSVALSLGFILLIGYTMQYLVKMEEESIQERYRRLGRAPPGSTQPKYVSDHLMSDLFSCCLMIVFAGLSRSSMFTNFGERLTTVWSVY